MPDLIVRGGTLVTPSGSHQADIAIEDDRALPQLTEWTKAAHDGGAVIFAQLNHPGRQSNLLALGHTPVAPSPASSTLSVSSWRITRPRLAPTAERMAISR